MRVAGLLMGLALTISIASHAETVAIQVQSAAVEHDDMTNQDFVDVRLAPDGRRSLAAFTRGRVGRVAHIRVDGVMLASPTVMSPIEGGALRLSPGAGGFGGMSAQEIVERLNAGSAMDVSDGK